MQMIRPPAHGPQPGHRDCSYSAIGHSQGGGTGNTADGLRGSVRRVTARGCTRRARLAGGRPSAGRLSGLRAGTRTRVGVRSRSARSAGRCPCSTAVPSRGRTAVASRAGREDRRFACRRCDGDRPAGMFVVSDERAAVSVGGVRDGPAPRCRGYRASEGRPASSSLTAGVDAAPCDASWLVSSIAVPAMRHPGSRGTGCVSQLREA